MTIAFEDAILASNLTEGLTHGVYYVDGRYANHWAVKARLPKAKLLGITVLGTKGKGIQICDCENGDLTLASAEAWVAAQIELGVYRPCVYASLSTWNSGLLTNLAHYGTKIRRWLALWDNVATIPQGYDAKQYINDVGGVDKSVALDTFFDTSAPKPPAPTPKPPPASNNGKIHAFLTLDLDTDVWTIHKVSSTGQRQVAEAYKAAVEIDVAPGSGDQLHIHRVAS